MKTKNARWPRLLLLLALGWPLAGWAAPMDGVYAQQVVSAIYKAEGGRKAAHPYGIMAKRRLTESEARRWCANTVRNNWSRWEAAGRPGDYLEFLSKRYAPIGAANDPKGLNQHWLKNVRYHLNKRQE